MAMALLPLDFDRCSAGADAAGLRGSRGGALRRAAGGGGTQLGVFGNGGAEAAEMFEATPGWGGEQHMWR